MVDLAQLNPLSKFDISLGTLGNALILFVIVLLIVAGIGWLIYWRISSKQYFIKIPLYRLVGNIPTRVATYRAKKFRIGKAGDYLWYVKGIKKFLPPATIQTAPNEYMHWEREDGEWINFAMDDLDKEQKSAGVKYIQQDMRSQRIATANILEQRLINKTFWEKYRDMIVHLIFYLVVMICMIVIFWQWSKIVTQTGELISYVNTLIKEAKGQDIVPEGVIPAMFLVLTTKFKIWRKK
jgi:hypothetical protein